MKKLPLDEFKASLKRKEPPEDFSPHEKALWYAGRGDWEKAHRIVQDMNDPSASRIHAFLHRQEGDSSNAHYWYNRAGIQMPLTSLDHEWEELVVGLK
jgi:hypothetical protein